MKKIFSLETFPPKKDDGIETIYYPLAGLAMLKPDFISVTYGANGGRKALTDEVCDFIKNGYKIESVAHLTCVGSSKETIFALLENLKNKNITSILALRGDLKEETNLTDYKYATDLIKDIVSFGGFNVLAACYPEGHVESSFIEQDLSVMTMKNDLGVSRFLSQLFFDNADFYNLNEQAKTRGITAPISAGIMPITNAKQIVRMVQMSGAKIPPSVSKMISAYENDPDSLRKAGLDYSITQIRDLLANGVDGIHLYTMNNVTTATTIYEGIRDLLE